MSQRKPPRPDRGYAIKSWKADPEAVNDLLMALGYPARAPSQKQPPSKLHFLLTSQDREDDPPK